MQCLTGCLSGVGEGEQYYKSDFISDFEKEGNRALVVSCSEFSEESESGNFNVIRIRIRS